MLNAKCTLPSYLLLCHHQPGRNVVWIKTVMMLWRIQQKNKRLVLLQVILQLWNATHLTVKQEHLQTTKSLNYETPHIWLLNKNIYAQL